MLGKRPHQIQRSTSMSQLRAPPGARSGVTSPLAQSAHVEDDSCRSSPASKTVSTFKPQAHMSEDSQKLEMKVQGAHSVNADNVGMPSSAHAHTDSLLRSPHVPHREEGLSSPLPKSTKVKSFLDACFFCRRPLGHGRDIFMYRGDAAFCTEECRLRQISCDEKCNVSASQTTLSDNAVGNPKGARRTPPTGAF